MRGAFPGGRLLRQQSGGSIVEFAILLPLLAVLLAGAADLGGLARTRMQVAAAARAGASYALANSPGLDVAAIPAAVLAATSLPLLPPVVSGPLPGCADAADGITGAASFATPCPDGSMPGKYIEVQTTTGYQPIIGWPGLSGPVTLSATAKVRIP